MDPKEQKIVWHDDALMKQLISYAIDTVPKSVSVR